jgi:ABC-type bacteriocin/lantibiotic exporter with double-glycine peptidase domain
MFRDQPAQLALAQIVVASVLLQAAGLAGPLFTKLVVDAGTREASVSLGLMAAAMTVVVPREVHHNVRAKPGDDQAPGRSRHSPHAGILQHLLALPYRFFQGKTSGDLLMRLSSNTMIREIPTTQLLLVRAGRAAECAVPAHHVPRLTAARHARRRSGSGRLRSR